MADEEGTLFYEQEEEPSCKEKECCKKKCDKEKKESSDKAPCDKPCGKKNGEVSCENGTDDSSCEDDCGDNCSKTGLRERGKRNDTGCSEKECAERGGCRDICAEKACVGEVCDEVMCCEPETKRWKRITLIVIAMALAVFSILYSLVEGSASIAFGASTAASLTLLEFGTDSLIEVAAGVVVLVK